MTKQAKAMTAAALGYCICGLSFLFSKKALLITEPFILLACRFALTVVVLNVMLLFGIIKVKIPKKAIIPAVVLGLVQPVLYFILENYGLKYTSTSFTGMLSSVSPIFATVLGVIFLRERPNVKQWLFTMLSIIGVALVSVGDGGGENTVAGVLCLFGAYLCGAVYNLLARYLATDLSPFSITYIMFMIGFAFFASAAFVMYGGETLPMIASALKERDFIISIFYLGAVSSVGAYSLINYSMGVLPVARATVFGSVSTIVSVLSGLIIMHDPFSPVNIAAFVLILVGIWGVNRFAAKEKTEVTK